MDTSQALTRAARLEAVRAAGVGARPDRDLERFARLASHSLGTPVALVSILEADRQVFPGQVGLPEPWSSDRATPLEQSLCQYVTAMGRPLVVADTRLDELTRTSAAIPDLDVIAYAGVPLTDDAGEVLGALCAIDHRPRSWDAGDLSQLTDLADACNAELRMRIAVTRADAALHEVERGRERAEILLRASEVLAGAQDVFELRERIDDLAGDLFSPAYVGLCLADDSRLRRVMGTTSSSQRLESFNLLDETWPAARAFSEHRTITINGARQLREDGYGRGAQEIWERLGLHSLIAKPLHGSSSPLGALVFAWQEPHLVEVTEDAVLTALAGYAATAIERLQGLDNRITTAIALQRAMLSEPALVPGIEIATLYRPASGADTVGGDWYDVHPLPQAEGPNTCRGAAHSEEVGAVALTVGDVMGHDMRAAAIMGQARSMLRQAGIDAPAHSPARALESVERAARVLGLDLAGTVVHGHLHRTPDGWELVWTNAGHPPPIVIGPAGERTVLREHDVLLHPDLDRTRRRDHRVQLTPGTTLLLFTDGLLDERRADQDAMLAEVSTTAIALLDERHGLDEVVGELADRIVAPGAEDDLAILAVRVR